MSKKYQKTTENETTKPSQTKNFEISYIVSGIIKTKIKAEDMDDAITKSLQATNISKAISGITGIKIEDVTIEKITDEQNETYIFEKNME